MAEDRHFHKKIVGLLNLLEKQNQQSSIGTDPAIIAEHDETQVKLDGIFQGLVQIEENTSNSNTNLGNLIETLTRGDLSGHEDLTNFKSYSNNTYQSMSFSVISGDADISLNGVIVNYKSSDNVTGFKLKDNSSSGVPDNVTVTPSLNSVVRVIYKSL